MAKKQHYIPQFLLRNWSEDGASINVYLCEKNKQIKNAPIDSQSQKNFYYGEDQKIESILSLLEYDSSLVISKLKKDTKNFDEEDKRILIEFIAMQNTRTPQKINKIDDIFTELGKSLLRKSGKFKNKEIDSVKMRINNHAFLQMLMFVQTVFVYTDLRIAFFKSSETKKFVIGQDPVVITNKFLTGRKWPLGKSGIGLHGVTVFLPLSPDITVCLYDNYVYSFIGNRMGHVLSDEEMDSLNKLQFLNTENSVYYSEFESYFTQFAQETREYRIQSSARLSETPVTDGKQIVMVGSKDYPYIPIQNFLVLKERSSQILLGYKSVTRPIVAASEEFLKKDPRLAQFIS